MWVYLLVPPAVVMIYSCSCVRSFICISLKYTVIHTFIQQKIRNNKEDFPS